ncbi:MAG: hypothetical protein ACT4TC_13965 [Myxococcaceae bacterium]
MVGKVGSNFSSYLPDLTDIQSFAESPDAEKSQQLLQQIISSFSADQKEVLFNQLDKNKNNIPDPIKRLRDHVKQLASGDMDPKTFQRELKRTITTARTVDGKDVYLPKSSDRLTEGSSELSKRLEKLTQEEMNVYVALRQAEMDENGGMPEEGETASTRFVEKMSTDNKKVHDTEKLKRIGAKMADAELEEDFHDAALISAAMGASPRDAIKFAKGEGTSMAEEGGLSQADRELHDSLSPKAQKTFLRAVGTYGSVSEGPGNSTRSNRGSSTSGSSYSTRSGASTDSSSSNDGISSRSGAATDANGNYIPSGISAPGDGAGRGIDVGNVTSIDLSPTEQQLYNKLKEEDPQAAERFFLQQKLAKISEMAAMLSNIAKMRHDAAMAIIGNMR